MLDIDDNVLAAAKDSAKAEGKSMGQVLSDLARRALTAPGLGFTAPQAAFGIDDWPTFADRGGMPVTTDAIKDLQLTADLDDGIAWDHGRDPPRGFDARLQAPTKARKR